MEKWRGNFYLMIQ